MTETAATIGLAMRLREGTAAAHRDAERTAFIRQFFKGQLKKDEYSRFLAALYPVYDAMEYALERLREHPAVGAFYMPEMFRCEALASDVRFFVGADWHPARTASKGSRDYAERVAEVANNDPPLLIAHVYTRFLGDLSGGQLMGKTAQKSLGLETDEGLSFCRFDAIPDVDAFKTAFRAKLDAMPLTAEEQERVILEARRSFELNHALTSEITLAA